MRAGMAQPSSIAARSGGDNEAKRRSICAERSGRKKKPVDRVIT
jgi:hypothetical protein